LFLCNAPIALHYANNDKCELSNVPATLTVSVNMPSLSDNVSLAMHIGCNEEKCELSNLTVMLPVSVNTSCLSDNTPCLALCNAKDIEKCEFSNLHVMLPVSIMMACFSEELPLAYTVEKMKRNVSQAI